MKVKKISPVWVRGQGHCFAQRLFTLFKSLLTSGSNRKLKWWFLFFLSAQSTGCRGLSKTWDYPKRRDWLQIVLVFHAVSLRWAQVLLPTVTLKAWWLLQIVPCCLIADGFHLSSGFLLLFVCFFTMIDREALTHGSKTDWNKQQHKAL